MKCNTLSAVILPSEKKWKSTVDTHYILVETFLPLSSRTNMTETYFILILRQNIHIVNVPDQYNLLWLTKKASNKNAFQ